MSDRADPLLINASDCASNRGLTQAEIARVGQIKQTYANHHSSPKTLTKHDTYVKSRSVFASHLDFTQLSIIDTCRLCHDS